MSELISTLARAQELFFSALEAQEVHDLPTAERLYREALELAPGRSSILNNLATVLHRQERYAESLAFSERLAALEPQNVDALVGQGLALAGLGRDAEALRFHEGALALEPDHVGALIGRAQSHAATGNSEAAIADLDRVLLLAPDNVDALVNRGNVLVDRHCPEAALADYRTAISIDPANAGILANLGHALLESGQPREALEACEKALRLDPHHPDAMQNRGNALRDLQRHDEALQSYRQAQQLAPDRAGPYWNESLCHLMQGDLAQGWRHYDRGWDAGQRGRHPKLRAAFWDGARVSGTLLAWGEQGIGDQILHCGMLDDLKQKADRLLVAVDPRLLPLLRRSYPGIDFMSLRDLPQARDIDMQIAMGDLGKHLRPEWEAFPRNRRAYLKADDHQVEELRSMLAADGMLVCGVSWRSANPRLGRFKTLPLTALRPLMSLPGVKFVDLQYGDTADEIAALGAAGGKSLTRVAGIDNFNDIDSLAALISACDLVVSVSNTTVHLAGALGKTTCVMLPHAQGTLWYWHTPFLTSPWYPACRLLRQPSPGDWGPVVTTVTAAAALARDEKLSLKTNT
jgi:tetratricopeptide (TPR) repeat protein